MIKFVAKVDTLLKKEDKDSSLGGFATVRIPRGREIRVEKILVNDRTNNHLGVRLAYKAGDWWIFKPHWEEDKISYIVAKCKEHGLTIPQTAYVLATIQHETNGLYKPVKEAYWLSEDWRQRNLRYYPWYGRGLVQTTWKHNYQRTADRFNRPDLMTNPDLLCEDFDLSLDATIIGMVEGWYSANGKGLKDYINFWRKDYQNARRTVNALDRADLIAGYAREWEKRLNG